MSDQIATAWNRLKALPQRSLQELFAADGARVTALSGRIEWPGEGGETGILFDWSKTHLDNELLAAFERQTALHRAKGWNKAPIRPRDNVLAELIYVRIRALQVRAEGFGDGATSFTWRPGDES